MHGLKEKNVANTCRIFGISRTIYYRWKKAYKEGGMQGLEEKSKKVDRMPNRTPKPLEEEILAYIHEFPEDGPKRIYYEMKTRGYKISESGVYKVMRRKKLTKKEERRKFSRSHFVSNTGKKKENNSLFKDKISVKKPGDLLIQGIDYMGSFQGVGRIYQYSLYDLYSGLAIVRIYGKKSEIDVGFLFDRKIRYLCKTFKVSIRNLCTRYHREFLPCFIGNAMLQRTMTDLCINHQFIDEQHDFVREANGFQKSLREVFYKKIEKEEEHLNFHQLEGELEYFVRQHNFFRPYERGGNQGKTPVEVVLESSEMESSDMESLPLWILALLNQRRRLQGNEDE